MALASKIYEGLAILLNYDLDAECDAQHDVLHVFGSPNKLENITAKDRADLEGLGWFLDDMEESWSHFT